jgi:small-conductance mechanosensitive channel
MPKQALTFFVPLSVFLISLILLLVGRRYLLAWVRGRADGKRRLAHVTLELLRLPSALWCLAGALAIALEFAEIPPVPAAWTHHAIFLFLVLSLSLVVSAIFVRAFTLFGQDRGIAFAQSGLSRALIHLIVFFVGALFLLRHFNLTITPLLTALGVGGLAVALALQDTLANFFAGIHILLEAPISVGEIIRLSSGEEGVVSDIGWRTTRVATGTNTIIVIPNTKITSSILTNFNMPDVRVVAEIPILTGLTANPDQVMALAREEAIQTPGVLADPPPAIFFDPGITPTHLQFKLTAWLHGKLGAGLIQSEIRLRVWRRFEAEGVPLPIPERTVHTKSGGAACG